MLKRVTDWEERASQLMHEICEHIPAQYKDIDCDRDKPEKEPVGYAWAAASLEAVLLADWLVNLRVAIEERTGIKLNTDSKSEGPEVQTPILGEKDE